MKKLFFLIIASQLSNAFSQLNTDSLMKVLHDPGKFTFTQEVKYMTEMFQRFKSNDKNEHYDVYIDSTGNLGEYIGLAIVHEVFDQENRITKRIGYSSKGTYSLWDFEPIMEWSYSKNTKTYSLYDDQYAFQAKYTETRDEKQRLIEEIYEDKNPTYHKKTIHQYDDALHTETISYYDQNGKLKPNENGASIIQLKKDPLTDQIIEERFYNQAHRPVDGEHTLFRDSNSRKGCRFCLVQYKKDAYNMNIGYCYNITGTLVCEIEMNPPYSIRYSDEK